MFRNPNTKIVRYGRLHVLQCVSITSMPHSDGYWVIYIHGGAWRDPKVTSASFDAAESILRASPTTSVAGFASISYRLSLHPDHPQDPEFTPEDEFRDAKHPDHIRDVEAALAFLQNTYGFGSRYILVGHSCGATLAFQAVMGAVAEHREQSFSGGADDRIPAVDRISTHPSPLTPRLSAHPTAIVGVAGIYDLRLLRDTHRDIPAYREFIEGAFESDEVLWDTVSPAQMVGSRGVEGGWKNGRLAVLAHSKDDELVDECQVDAMREVLKAWEEGGVQTPEKKELKHKERRVEVLTIIGAHDEAWSRGEELARAITFTFEQLQKMGLV